MDRKQQPSKIRQFCNRKCEETRNQEIRESQKAEPSAYDTKIITRKKKLHERSRQSQNSKIKREQSLLAAPWSKTDILKKNEAVQKRNN